jgi:hypothetical protein
MRRLGSLSFVLVVLAAMAVTILPATAAVAGWGKALAIDGPGGTSSRIWAISCASPGNCSAGGSYPAAGGQEAFVVTETKGVWGKPVEVPGLARLNTGHYAITIALSCAAAGDCTAGGLYGVRTSVSNQSFVVTETNGHWGTAEEVPGSGALNGGTSGAVTTVSCSSPGHCAVGGLYLPSDTTGYQTFLADQVGGRWGRAFEVPGTARLNVGDDGQLVSVSCRAAGQCTAAGNYSDTPGGGGAADQAFVVTETRGQWGMARSLPGIPRLTGHGTALLQAVSCGSAGNCGATGTEWNGQSQVDQAFVDNQVHGRWGRPRIVPGITALPGEHESFTGPENCFVTNCLTISCPSAGNCAAAGSYGGGKIGGYVVSETRGTWGRAVAIPGLASLEKGQDAEFYGVSCGAAGSCSAAGYYESSTRSNGPRQAFVVTETGGRWGTATEVPGSARLNTGAFGGVYALSCPAAGHCAAAGWYNTKTIAGAFVTSLPGTP